MLNKIKETLNSENGFTLIEMMVVIVIIGILASIALPTFSGMLDDARESQSKSEARSLYGVLFLQKELDKIGFSGTSDTILLDSRSLSGYPYDRNLSNDNFFEGTVITNAGFDDTARFFLDGTSKELTVAYPITNTKNAAGQAEYVIITTGFVGTLTDYLALSTTP